MAEQQHRLSLARIINSEVILLSLLTATSYYYAFSFEKGYIGYYLIPDAFVVVSIEKVIRAFAVISVFGYIIAAILEVILQLIPEYVQRRTYVFVKFSIIILFGFLIYFYPDGGVGAVIWYICLTLFLLKNFAFALKHREGTKYLDRLDQFEEDDYQAISSGFIIKLGKLLGGRWLLVLIFLVFFVPIFIPKLAAYEAKSRQKYPVFRDGEEWVVVQTYGDRSILVGIDSGKKEILMRFRVVDLTDVSDRSLTIEEVGPLKAP